MVIYTGQLLILNSPPAAVATSTCLENTTTPQSPISLLVKAAPTNNTLQFVEQSTPTLQTKTTPTTPKPKLTREEKEAQRIEREKIKAEIIAKREEERVKKEQEKAKKETEKK